METDPDTRAAYRRAAVEIITFLADHLDDAELREAFLALPDVGRLL